MKRVIVLALVLMMTASFAIAASGAGFGEVDIVGSKLNNIQIVSSDDGFGDIEKHLDVVGSKLENIEIFSEDTGFGNIEIVGSKVTNVLISPPPSPPCNKDERQVGPSCEGYQFDSKGSSCFKPHLGVDAWYGRYWYMDEIYTPKWPQF
jgi:hypothetical protein